VEALEAGKVSRIVLSRPAVEAGESLGFLPGDLNEKLAPYLRPLYDALTERLGTKRLKAYIADGIIEIAPVAYMRGRTLSDCFVVIDEAQRQPGLFPVLRVLADRPGRPATFLLLGSASPELSRQTAESLAGRVEIIEMRGLDLGEVPAEAQERLWWRGGFPRSFLAENDVDSVAWRKNFTRTFLERDLALLGFGLSPALMGRLWTMIAHYHGQIWNGSELAASLGVAPNTVRAYLDALEQTYMVRRLQPWHTNLGKRVVKKSKIYLRDSGLLHTLLGLRNAAELRTHPKLGASWEGFVIEELLRALGPDEAYFYAVHSGSELDLMLVRGGRRIGVEVKWADAPGMTRSMHVARADLKLDELWVVYPGERTYALSDQVTVLPLAEVLKKTAP
jgi:predicted AAA+ superfamily ATPase